MQSTTVIMPPLPGKQIPAILWHHRYVYTHNLRKTYESILADLRKH